MGSGGTGVVSEEVPLVGVTIEIKIEKMSRRVGVRFIVDQ